MFILLVHPIILHMATPRHLASAEVLAHTDCHLGQSSLLGMDQKKIKDELDKHQQTDLH